MVKAIKITLSLNPYKERGGGSYSFARVLAEKLTEYGFEVSFNLKGKCDIILVFAHFADIGVLKKQKKRGVKIVHRLDEWIPPHESELKSEKHKKIKEINSLADITIYQSKFVSKNISRICAPGESTIIYNGVDQNIFNHSSDKKVVLEGSPKIMHVSWSTGDRKRIDRLEELIMATDSNAVIYLIGRHNKLGFSFLNHPKIRLLGVKERNEIAAYMRSCDFLFFPSEFEPCPNTVIEALSCGLPILYHNSGATPELIGNAGIPISSDLEEGVKSILEQKEILSKKALERAKQFSSTVAVKNYVKVFNVF